MIIGMVGYKNCGKSTLIKEFVKEQMNFIDCDIIGFSEPLYDFMYAIGYTEEDVMNKVLREKPREELGGKSLRDIMVIFGTKAGRNMISQDLWIDIGIKRIKKSKKKLIFIESVRFPNEMESLRELGAKFIYVKDDTKNADGLESEMHIENLGKLCDLTIDNTDKSTPEELTERSFEIFKLLTKPIPSPY